MLFILFRLIINNDKEIEGFTVELIEKKRPLELGDYKSHFEKPIIYYFKHENDKTYIFPTFAVVDLAENEINYYSSYTKDNLEKLDEHDDVLSYMNQFCTPHNAVSINKDEFYVFTYAKCNFFYHVNMKTKTMDIITGKDLGLENVLYFGDTFNLVNNSIYLIAATKINGGYATKYYDMSSDTKELEFLFEDPLVREDNFPHSTQMLNGLILSSKFRGKIFRIDGKTYDDIETFDFVYSKYFDEMNSFEKISIHFERVVDYVRKVITKVINFFKYDRGEFKKISYGNYLRENKVSYLTVQDMVYQKVFNKDFFMHYLIENYDYTLVQGRILVYDPKSKSIGEVNTSYSKPAHFVELGEHIYISNHNLGSLKGRLFYYGPGSLDKFSISDSKLIFEKKFENPKGYRFTTHRGFHYKGKPYVVTFGHPNRLMIADAETMTLYQQLDIEEDYLSEVDDMLSYMNENEGSWEYQSQSMEVSEDGEYIVFVLAEHFYIYSFEHNTIIDKFEIKSQEMEYDYGGPDQFRTWTLHSDRLI